jgi:hypothetical protein
MSCWWTVACGVQWKISYLQKRTTSTSKWFETNNLFSFWTNEQKTIRGSIQFRKKQICKALKRHEAVVKEVFKTVTTAENVWSLQLKALFGGPYESALVFSFGLLCINNCNKTSPRFTRLSTRLFTKSWYF